MNCDEAFDALTDPNQRDNQELRWHLEFCPRCRGMQDVLAPALSLLGLDEEPLEPQTKSNRLAWVFSDLQTETREESSVQQATPKPFLTPEAVRVAEHAAQTLHADNRPLTRKPMRWLAVGVVCLLTACGLFLATASAPNVPASGNAEPMMLADHCLWINKNQKKTAKPPARWVVLSCVSCHLGNTPD